MISHDRWHRSTVSAIVSLFLISGLVAANEEPASGGDAASRPDDLRQDAVEYSITFGVPLEEALRRLELQPALGSLIYQMQALAPARFAGGWIEHEPEHRVVVSYTGEGDELAAVMALAESSPAQ